MDETHEIISKLLDISQRSHEAMEPPVPIIPVNIVVTTSCHDKYNENDNDTIASPGIFAHENRIILHIDAVIMSDTGGKYDDNEPHHRHPYDHNPAPRLEGAVLYPGSLRERGEYCLVQFQVVPDDGNTTSSTTSSSHDTMFHWEVTSVDFRRVGDAARVVR